MGLAASQARLLTLTSRMSSIELRQQSIANEKIMLSNATDVVSNKYTTALNNQKIQMYNGNASVDISIGLLNAQGYSVMRASDKVVASSEGETNDQVSLYNQIKTSPDFLSKAILSGYLVVVDSDGNQVSLSSNTEFSTVYDKSDDASAEAEYNAEISKIHRKEKMLDNQLSKLDTEHSALTKDFESVKSIISEHAQKDFNLFG